jgi:hypothetical protein
MTGALYKPPAPWYLWGRMDELLTSIAAKKEQLMPAAHKLENGWKYSYG